MKCLPLAATTWLMMSLLSSLIVIKNCNKKQISWPHINDPDLTTPGYVINIFVFSTSSVLLALVFYFRHIRLNGLTPKLPETALKYFSTLISINTAGLFIGILIPIGLLKFTILQRNRFPVIHYLGFYLFFIAMFVYMVIQTFLSFRMVGKIFEGREVRYAQLVLAICYAIFFILFLIFSIIVHLGRMDIGVVLSQDGVRSKILCENDVTEISCPDNMFLNITEASWGRSSPEICPTKHPNSGPCNGTSKDAENVVKQLCQGFNSCYIEVTADFLKSDPCTKVYKYLSLSWRCLRPSGSWEIVVNISSSFPWILVTIFAVYVATLSSIFEKSAPEAYATELTDKSTMYTVAE